MNKTVNQQEDNLNFNNLPEKVKTAIIEATYLRELLEEKDAEVLRYMREYC